MLFQSFFLSPSAVNICLICHVYITIKHPNDTDNTYKLKLWKATEKTQACIDVENYFEENLIKNRDFQAICRSCYRNIKNHLNARKSKKESLKAGRNIAEEQFLRSRERRTSLTAPPSKKQLLYISKDKRKSVKNIVVQYVNDDESQDTFTISPKHESSLTAILKDDVTFLIHSLCDDNPEILQGYVNGKVSAEVQGLCKLDQASVFRLEDVNAAENISYMEQYEELSKKAPLLKGVMTSAAVNPKANIRNVTKKSETLIPSIANASSILLFCHNKTMNANAALNSLMLRRGKSNKMVFARFNALHMCLSHTSLLNKQLELGKDYLLPIKEFGEKLQHSAKLMSDKIKSTLQSEDMEISLELSDDPMSSSMTLYAANADESFLEEGAINPKVDFLNISNNVLSDDTQSSEDSFSWNLPSFDPVVKSKPILAEIEPLLPFNEETIVFEPKYMMVGDNVDIRTKRRRYLIDRGVIDRHFFNLMVVCNRISIPDELLGIRAPRVTDVFDIPIHHFAPTVADESLLREEIKVLVSRDLVKYIDELAWMKKLVENHIPHQYSDKVATKSEIFPCGIIDQNENTTEGIIEIMKYQQKLISGNGSQHVRVFSVGDLLTVEREQNAQGDLRDSPTCSSRLEGLIPALADFHTFGNFMEVIWHILYHPSSSMDIGTLFQARNFLNARTVPASPMKDINACEELILKYSEALIITAFDKFKNETNINIVDTKDEIKNKELMETILNAVVDVYILPEAPVVAETKSLYDCFLCGKSYKQIKSLRDHLKKVHKKSSSSEEANRDVDSDYLLNYSKNELALCYIIKDLTDARKHGDGMRILRLYKFLLIYFKIDGRTKYSFQSLHLLAQVNYLLPPPLAHELTWNRFVNTKGGVNTNVELDRHLEHLNKYAKADLAQYQGKITEKSVARCSRSYYKMQKILEKIDAQISVKRPSGRHSSVDWSDDVKQLANQYKQADIFGYHVGRSHSRFPGFPKSFPATLNILSFKKWIYKKMSDFSKMNVYQQDDIYTHEEDI